MAKLSVLFSFGLVLLLGKQTEAHENPKYQKRQDKEEVAVEYLSLVWKRDKYYDELLKVKRDKVRQDDDNRAPTEHFIWPELIGKPGEEAKKAVLVDHPDFEVVISPDDTPVEGGVRSDRVIIYVDKEGNVSLFPYIG